MNKWLSTGCESLAGAEYVCPECGGSVIVPENQDIPMECPECGIELDCPGR